MTDYYISEFHIQANGIDFACRSAGDGPLVLCLHGFPDCWKSFDTLLPELAKAGYRAVAPAMRGYAPSSLARDGRYRIRDLAADVSGLIDALGADRAAVIGHDWGAVAAYSAAGMTPEKLACVITAAVPPLRHIVLRPSLRQYWRSRYILFFQLGQYAVRHCLANDLAFIERLWRQWCPGWEFDASAFDPVRDAIGEPQRMRAVLYYYRELAGTLFDSELRRRVLCPCEVPAMVVNGERDGCFGPDVFQNLQHCFAGPFEACTIREAGHFLHREQPEPFAERVMAFLEREYQ